VTETGKQ